VVTWARARGCLHLKVETQNINMAACRFYEQEGCVLRTVQRGAYPELPEEVQLLWFKDLPRRTQAGFRSVASLVANPEHRTRDIDVSGDWWYVDDLAAEYLRAANQEDQLKTHDGTRIFIPNPTGTGQDVIDWLEKAV
jgi:hypothetical protein